MQNTLSKNQLKYLRGLCHQLHPVVMVAEKGLTETVMEAIQLALNDHELIKIRIRTEREQRASHMDTITQSTGAQLVQKIGQVACYYRRHPEDPQLAIPSR